MLLEMLVFNADSDRLIDLHFHDFSSAAKIVIVLAIRTENSVLQSIKN